MLTGNHPDLYELSRPAGKQSLPIELFIGDRAHRNQAGLMPSNRVAADVGTPPGSHHR